MMFPAVLSAQQERIGVNSSSLDLSSYLAGRASGISFRQTSGAPGSFTTLQVRNFGEPLYVIDGLISTAEEFNTLDPSAIVSYRIISDAEAANLYGQLGANGVISVTTARTSSYGKPAVRADIRYGLQDYTCFPEQMNDFQTQYAYDMKAINDGILYGEDNLASRRMALEEYISSKDDRITYDPAALIFATTSVAGGSRKLSYDVGLSLLSQNGVASDAALKKATLKAALHSMVGENLSLSWNLLGNKAQGNSIDHLRSNINAAYSLPVKGLSLNASGAFSAYSAETTGSKGNMGHLRAGLDYDRTFGHTVVSASSGYEYYSFETSEAGKSSLGAAFISASSQYDSRYYISGGLRYDSSKSFDSVFLPYAKAVWNLSSEHFYRRSSLARSLSEISFSASYGKTDLSSAIADAGIKLGFGQGKASIGTDVFARLGDSFTPGMEINLSFGSGSDVLNWHIDANMMFARNMGTMGYGASGYGYDSFWNSKSLLGPDVWMYRTIGQFTSAEDIKAYTVNIDGKNNTTLVPGDLIYKDFNCDGVINSYDLRPAGYSGASNGEGLEPNPCLCGGLTFSLNAWNLDFSCNVTGGTMYSWSPAWISQNTNSTYAYTSLDVWHKSNIYDPDSDWVAGKFPAYRSGSMSTSVNSDFWNVNVAYLRLKDICLGYTFKLKHFLPRIYVCGSNLLTIDNLSSIYGADPESSSDPVTYGSPYKSINVGIDIRF